MIAENLPQPTPEAVPCNSRRLLLQREEGKLVLRCLDCEAEIKEEGH